MRYTHQDEFDKACLSLEGLGWFLGERGHSGERIHRFLFFLFINLRHDGLQHYD